MNKRFLSDLRSALTKAREIVRYYRTGPLGDIAAANGKIVEEAIRHVLEKTGKAPVTTTGLVDLGVAEWGIGFQVKTFRKSTNNMIFARSSKGSKKERINDIRTRVVESLVKSDATELYLLDIDMFSSDVGIYHLASIKGKTLITHGSFLTDENVWVSPTGTQFNIRKKGLVKIA